MLCKPVFTTAALVGSAIGLALSRPQETKPSSLNPAQERVTPISPFQISNLTAGTVVLSHRDLYVYTSSPLPNYAPTLSRSIHRGN